MKGETFAIANLMGFYSAFWMSQNLKYFFCLTEAMKQNNMFI